MSAWRSHPNFALRNQPFAPGVPGPRLLYRSLRRLFRVSFATLWRVEVLNRHLEPTQGSAVYISNHQSFLDPIVMSFALQRPMNYMARDTLFHVPGFRQLIAGVNAFPVRRGVADMTAMKEALRRLRDGHQLVVFAEGTRTRDGSIGPFLPGVAMLAQRAAEWTVPVVIDGAYECWPRSSPVPFPGRIAVVYGQPLHRDVVRKMPAEELVETVRNRMIQLQAELRRRRKGME